MRKYYNKISFWKQNIEYCYRSYGINIELVEAMVITEFQRVVFKVKILPGTRVKRIHEYAKDIMMALQLPLLLPFEKENCMYIAVSETLKTEKSLLKILNHPKFMESDMQIPLALGYDYMGNVYIADLAKILHLIISGPSCSGKSVTLQCVILSMIMRCSVEELRLIIFDIGGNSLDIFKTVKHLYYPIVKDHKGGMLALEAILEEIDMRTLMGEEECKKLPFLICVFDEFDDTIANISNEKEKNRFQSLIRNIVNRGRKCKVIVIITSLNPSEKETKININGIDSRISFKCIKHQKSVNALGITGAQNLSGIGSMLFIPKGGEKVTLQGAYISKEEILSILKNTPEECDDLPMLEVVEVSNDDFLFEIENANVLKPEKKEYADVIVYTLGQEKISEKKIKEKFGMGNRAKNYIDFLYSKGIISEKNSNQPRDVLPKSIDDLEEGIISFLEKYGYTKERLGELFLVKINNNEEIKV